MSKNNPLVNYEAEVAVLGSILIDAEALWLVRGVLQPDDFSLARNQRVYEAILALADRGEPLDAVTVPDEVARHMEVDEQEIVAYIAELMNATPSAVNALSYAETVAQDADRRRLLAMASEIARRVHDRAIDPDMVRSWIVGTAIKDSRGGEIKRAADVVDSIYSEFERNIEHPLKPGEVRGINTGWIDLNTALGGWKPGLYVVLGEPHVGKSWFVLEATANVAAQGMRSLLFSLEMTAEQLVLRECLGYAGISQLEYENGRVDQDAMAHMFERMDEISAWPWDIVDDQDSVGAIMSTIHRECRGPRPPAVVAIDYLGIIATDYRAANRNEELSQLLRSLKRLANSCQVPLLVPHQISDKAIESRNDKRPRKSDGYASGGISQHADVILGLYDERLHAAPEAIENPNALEVLKLKDRLSGGADPYSRVFLRFAETGGLRDYTKRQPLP